MLRFQTSLTFLSSIMKLQKTSQIQCMKPALYLCTGELSVRFAGHSKWQNIRHTKAAKDKAKGQLYNKVIKEIEKATRGASTDPKLNSELSKVITYAQSCNMPASTINKAITRIEYRRKNPTVKMFSYRGPSGLLVVVSTISDDYYKTRSTLNRISKKYNWKTYEGDLISAFETKGWILAKPPADVTDVADKSLEDAIEVGAEEVEPDEEMPERLKFVCEMSDLQRVRSKLESRNYTIEESTEMYFPRMPVELPEDIMEAVNIAIEEMEELPEVEKIILNVV